VKFVILPIVLLVALALGAATVSASAEAAEEVRALRNTPVNAPDVAPDLHKVEDGVRHDRAFRQQPPLVPHAIDKYEIDLKVNQCLRCHEWPYSDQERAPKISDLHYIDRNGVRQDSVNGNRYVCTQCHVPQVDAKPLVENRFRPATVNR